MNNYFSIGLDAKIAYEFHQRREERPGRARSRSKLFMWYGMLGGRELLAKSYRNLEQSLHLECDGVPVRLPSLQGIVVLNIPRSLLSSCLLASLPHLPCPCSPATRAAPTSGATRRRATPPSRPRPWTTGRSRSSPSSASSTALPAASSAYRSPTPFSPHTSNQPFLPESPHCPVSVRTNRDQRLGARPGPGGRGALDAAALLPPHPPQEPGPGPRPKPGSPPLLPRPASTHARQWGRRNSSAR